LTLGAILKICPPARLLRRGEKKMLTYAQDDDLIDMHYYIAGHD
jgi:hypothetical protein